MIKNIHKYLSTGIILFLVGILIMPMQLFASVAANYTVTNNGSYEVGPSDTNQLALQVDLPDPNGTDTTVAGLTVAGTQGTATFPAGWSLFGVDAAAGAAFATGSDWIGTDDDGDGVYTSAGDSIITDNSDTPSAGDALSSTWTNMYYSDNDGGSDYDDGEVVVSSADATLDLGLLDGTATDEVITAGTADITAFASTLYAVDNSAGTNGDYDDGEAIFTEDDGTVEAGQLNAGNTQIVTSGDVDLDEDLAGGLGGLVYNDESAGTNWDTGEDMFTDDDGDAVYTSAIDTLVDADGSGSTAAGTLDALAAAGDALIAMGDDIGSGGVAICTDSLASPVHVRIDLDGDCSNNSSTDGTYILGSAAAAVEVTSAWAFGDPVTMGGNGDADYDDGEDIFIENYAGELTYSAAADTLIYQGAGADTIAAGDALSVFIDADNIMFIDSDHSGSYNDGEPIVETDSGDIAPGGDLTSADELLARDSGNWTMDWTQMSTITDIGYCDNSHTNAYVDGEAIVQEAAAAAIDTTLETTDTVLTTGTCDLYTNWGALNLVHTNGGGNYTNAYNIIDENVDGEMTWSAAADTLVGGIAVSAGDTLVNMNSAKPGDWSILLIDDGGVVGTWESGSDMIFNDDDTSGYYNADDLTSIVINSTGDCVDADITAIRIWEDTDGDDTFNSSNDAQIGSDTTTPFINQTITTTATLYTSANNFRTIFATVDFAATPTHNCTFVAQIPISGVVLASNNDGPTDSAVATTDTLTADSQVTITDGNISITSSGSGSSGVEDYIIGDTLVAQWDDSLGGDNNGDISGTPTVDFTAFDGGAAVVMEDDGAGGNCDDGGVGDDVWCGAYTIVAGSVDSDVANNLNVSVSATDDQSNNATTADTTGLDCDDINPALNASGLIISIDGGVASVAAVNGGAVPPDQVTVNATVSSADGDTITWDATPIGGVAATANNTAAIVQAGGIDSGAYAFMVTATDNNGNSITVDTNTIDTTTISLDNTIPIITTPGTITLTDTTGENVASIGENLNYAGGTPGAADGDTWTTDLSAYALSATQAVGSVAVVADDDDGAISATETITDDAGNTATGASTIFGFTDIDNVSPNITDNGTLTITTDNGVALVAALNDGATNQDKVTQSAITLSNPDSDTFAIDLTALTGDAALPLTVESGVLVPGILDNAVQTFTITATDNAGNTAATASDAISVDNEAPVIDTPGDMAMGATDNGTIGTADVGDTVAYTDAVDSSTADTGTVTWTVDLLAPSDLTGNAAATSAAEETVVAGGLNGNYTFTETGTDDAGNTVTGLTATPLPVYTVSAGSLTSTDVELSSYWINGDVAATITFKNTTQIPANGKIIVIFPAGYDVSGVNNASSPDTSVDGTFLTTSDFVDTVTIERLNTGNPVVAGTNITLKITTLKNPATAGTTGTYTFQTQTNGGSALDENTSVSGDTIIDPDSGGDTTGGTTGGGGGGGGGGGAQTNATSNTRTSTVASKIDTITANQRYSRPVQFNEDQITINVDDDTASVQATGEKGTLTIKPNSKSTIDLVIPSNTTVTSDANWSGRIDPPLIRSLTNIHPSGEEIIGSDELLERADVAVLVEVGDGGTLTFSNDITLTIPVDLPDGSIVNVYFSEDDKTWESKGTGVVKDGYVVITTDHLSLYALEMTDETEAIIEEIEEAEALASSFYDTSGHWAESYIEDLADMGVVSGKTATTFAPNDNITRAELTKIALKALGYSIDPNVGDTYFSDVSSSDWYASYVVAARDSGIVTGYEGNVFSPNGMVNRAEALKILIGAAGFADVDSNFQTNYTSNEGWWYAGFEDVPIDSWFGKYIAYAKDYGIVGGYSDGSFGPGNNISRAEVSKMIMKILEMQ